MALLKVLKGTGLSDHVSLDEVRSLLGRHPSCQIIVDANAVSRQHAQIIRDGDGFLIEDLSSRNGTYVNDRRLNGRQLLREGDTIKVCNYMFQFSRGLETVPQCPLNVAGQPSPPQDILSSFQSTGLLDNQDSDLSGITSRLELSNTATSYASSISAEKRLRTLLEITNSLSHALTLDEMLPRVLDSLFKIFDCERGFVFLTDIDDESRKREWFRTRNPDEKTENLRVSRTIIRHVIDNREAIVSADAAHDARFDMSHSIVSQHVRSIMCAPILNSDGSAIGCLQVDTFSQKTAFEQEDLEVLATVAMQAGLAIENARLMENAMDRREVERDLELAHEVQNSILPRHLPKIPGYDFHSFYQPTHQIGGDYYDFVNLPDGRMAVLVADVVGHGISAALLMARFSAEARFALAAHPVTGDAIRALNCSFSAMQFDRFVTLVVAVLDPRNHSVVFVNAGHNPPLIRNDNAVRELPREISGLPLGIRENINYSEYPIQLAPGDTIVMYTDGVTESVNEQQQEYGMPRLKNRISDAGMLPASELGNLLVDDLHSFSGGQTFGDDVCIVCFGRE